MYLANPTALLAALPAIALGVLWIRTPMFLTPFGKRLLLNLKWVILALLVFALTDPRLPEPGVEDLGVVCIAADVSESIDPGDFARRLAEVASACCNLPGIIEPRLVLFDARTSALSPEDTRQWLRVDHAPSLATCRAMHRRENGTDLADGLRAAIAQIPPGRPGQIILLSDGRDLSEAVPTTIAALVEQAVPVQVVPVATRPPPPVPFPVRIVMPATTYLGEEVEVQVLAHAPKTTEVTVQLTGTDGTRTSAEVTLSPGYSSHALKVRTNTVGPQVFTARLSTRSGPRAPAELGAVHRLVNVKRLPRVLVFEASPAHGRMLRDLLRAEKVDFVSAHPASWPADLPSALRAATCIVLNNIARDRFKDAELVVMRDVVKDGGGLMMIGGQSAYGSGGWTDTPVEEAMPVYMPRRTIGNDLALVLVLDVSGSMAGTPWNYAAAAGREILKLARGGTVGVLLFNHAPHWMLPLGPLVDAEGPGRMLSYPWPRGGTVYSMALIAAYQELSRCPLPNKRVIMMSDGEPNDRGMYRSLLPQFKDDGITVTTVAAGHNIDARVLQDIAAETGGRFYLSLEFADLPKLFQEEFKRIAGPPIREGTIRPVLADASNVAQGIRPDEIPPLTGLSLTLPKETATVAITTDRSDPVVAEWRYGLGRSIALTPDLLPNWSQAWAKWDGLGKLIRQSVKRLAENSRADLAVAVNQRGQQVDLAVDWQPVPGVSPAQPPAWLNVPGDRGSRPLPLASRGNGRFTASFIAAPGIVQTTITDSQGRQLERVPVPVNPSAELWPGEVNHAMLHLIAQSSGGQVHADFANGLPTAMLPPTPVPGSLALWPWFAVLALLLYVVDIYLRKLNIFGLTERPPADAETGESGTGGEIYRSLAAKFAKLAEEQALRGNETEARRYYLRAKAFYTKANASNEARLMWERYNRFETRH